MRKDKTMYKTAALIAAAICFAIGAFNKLAPSDDLLSKSNWTNAGLCFITLSLLV